MRQAFAANKGEIAAVILEPVPANAGLYLPEPGFLELLRSLCNESGAVLIFDEVMTGFRLSPVGRRRSMGSFPTSRPGQDHRRRAAGGSLWRTRGHHGPPLARRAGVPGGYAFRESCRHGGGTRPARRTRRSRRLERVGAARQPHGRGRARGYRGQAAHLSAHRLDVLPLLPPGPVRNLAEAKLADREKFARFFHAALDRGVYFAPRSSRQGSSRWRTRRRISRKPAVSWWSPLPPRGCRDKFDMTKRLSAPRITAR